MKKYFLILCTICFSCAEQKSTFVEIYGISFTCPQGWKITETEDYGTGKYVSIEKRGLSSSGLVTMSFTEENFELLEYLQIFQESFKKRKIFTNLVFHPAMETFYGKYKGIASSYTVSVLSVKHTGKIYVFRENGITMAIIHQEAMEDHKKNLRGFEIIKESLIL